MRRFTGWKISTQEDDGQNSPPIDSSPTRSHRSSNSTSSRACSSLGSAKNAPKSREHSPSRSAGAATAGSSVGGVAGSNKKMLKIGSNVRFRGDVMECDTVVLCGRLQGFVETRRMTIKEGGKFVGNAKVEEVDVYGSLEGSLESTAKVAIRSTGLVSGNVIYKSMMMEDGGELEGTFERSNRASSRLSSMEGLGPSEGGINRVVAGRDEAASSTGTSGAVPSGDKDDQDTTSPTGGDRSPVPWQHDGEEDSSGEAAEDGARAAAGKRGGTSGSGTYSGSAVSPSKHRLAHLLTPPETKTTTTTVAPIPPVAAAGGSLRRVPPTHRISTSGAEVRAAGRGSSISTPVRAPSPFRSGGLQVQNLGAEASELFSTEAVTPVASDGSELVPSRRRSSLTGGNDGSADEGAAEGGNGTSVAARVTTWPPPSPVPTSRLWQKRTENVTPTPAPNRPHTPTSAPAPPAASISPTAAPKSVKNLLEAYTLPAAIPEMAQARLQQREQEQQGSSSQKRGPRSAEAAAGVDFEGNGVGVGGGGAGGEQNGGAVKDRMGGLELERERKEGDDALGVSGPVKACESENCFLEACWGDPRFRPRYCARHKKQGSKLMELVEQEEGEEAALPEGVSPPVEPLPSPADSPTDIQVPPGGSPSAQPVAPPVRSKTQPFQAKAWASPPPVAEPELVDSALARLRTAGGGMRAALATAMAAGPASTGSSADRGTTDDLDSDDEDEGWGSSGPAVVASVGGRLVGASNGTSHLRRASGGGGASGDGEPAAVGVRLDGASNGGSNLRGAGGRGGGGGDGGPAAVSAVAGRLEGASNGASHLRRASGGGGAGAGGEPAAAGARLGGASNGGSNRGAGGRGGGGGDGGPAAVSVVVGRLEGASNGGSHLRGANGGDGGDGGPPAVAAIGGQLEGASNGDSNLRGAGGGGGGVGVGLGVQPALPLVRAELVRNDYEDDEEPAGDGGGGGRVTTAADAEAEDMGDVRARIASYGRLSGKMVQVPSLPKPKAQKPKKKTGQNIADFYGGGESDEDEGETSFNMDAYNKGVLLSQAAEAGTHTEDGQLRPQASTERDQQRLAHLVRVGKLGSALGGRGVSAVKRR